MREERKKGEEGRKLNGERREKKGGKTRGAGKASVTAS